MFVGENETGEALARILHEGGTHIDEYPYHSIVYFRMLT